MSHQRFTVVRTAGRAKNASNRRRAHTGYSAELRAQIASLIFGKRPRAMAFAKHWMGLHVRFELAE